MDFASLLSQFTTMAPQITAGMPGAPPMAAPPPSLPSVPPMAPPPPMPMAPRPMAPVQQKPSGRDQFLQMVPLILMAFQQRKDPNAVAALLQGVMRGTEASRARQMAQQEREDEKRKDVASMMQRFAGDALQLDDPQAFTEYLDLAENVLGQYDPSYQAGTLRGAVRFPASKQLQRKKADAVKKLAEVESRYPELVDNPAFDAMSVTMNGGQTTIGELRKVAELQVTDATGQAVPSGRRTPANLQGDDLKLHAKARELGVRVDQLTVAQITEALNAGKPEAAKSMRPVEVFHRGRKVWANYNPADGTFTDTRGNALPDAQPLPDKPTGGSGGGSGRGGNAELIAAIMEDPTIFDSLTPTVKSRIAADLSAAGFKGFGRPLGDVAITKMAESKAAVQSLRDLRAILQKNEQFLGPVAGLSAMNPYSEARKAQADIDRVRQRVGKALEGGVLRKEDEEKYKKILATLRDEPTTAIYKIDQLILTLESDLKEFENAQRSAGRRVGESAPKKPTLKVGEIKYRADGTKVRVTGFAPDGKALVEVVK